MPSSHRAGLASIPAFAFDRRHARFARPRSTRHSPPALFRGRALRQDAINHPRLVTSMCPPCGSTSPREMQRPTIVPPIAQCFRSTRSNRSN